MMKQLKLTFVVLIISCFTVHAQTYLKEFGKIGKDEIELNEYDQDKEAEAVVLFDMAKSYFVENESSFDVVFERATRIKIISEAGIKWAEVEIPFYQEGGICERIYDIEAYSYNFEDGRLNKTQFNVSNVYDEKINNYWNVKKFAVPNVKTGSIIEYRYKINSQYKFNFRDWEFQWRIPVVYSEYEVKMIPFYEYKFILQGAGKFDVYESFEEKGMGRSLGTSKAYNNNTYSDLVYKYGMKDVPAFKDEEFISSINDYIIKLDFQLAKIHNLNGSTIDIIGTWEELIKELLKHPDFGGYVKKSEKLASKLLNTESYTGKTDKEKFDYVLDYVKNNYGWNNTNDKYASKSPAKLIEEKHGNCADINLFTIGLLNGMGIEAYPIIISTRNHGKINSDNPFSHFFNYVLVLANVDGKKILSDATDVLSLNDRIPTRCINDKGLIIKKDNIEWQGLGCKLPSEIKTETGITFTNENIIGAAITETSTEYDAFYYRNYYTDKIETIKKKLDSKNYSIKDSTISVQNQLNKEKPYILSYELTSKPERMNDKVYISPFFNKIISDNPLKQDIRVYPIDMVYPKVRRYKTSFTIPKGYQLEYLPESKTINNQLFSLSYQVMTNDDIIIVVFDYYFKSSVYSPDDYSKIKYYFNEIIKKGNEKIVLSKSL